MIFFVGMIHGMMYPHSDTLMHLLNFKLFARPQYVTKFKPAQVAIVDAPSEESNKIAALLSDLLYDPRFCYAHTWKTGDILIADNIEVGFLTHKRSLPY